MQTIKCSVATWSNMTFHFCNRPYLASCRECGEIFCQYHSNRHEHINRIGWSLDSPRGRKYGTAVWVGKNA